MVNESALKYFYRKVSILSINMVIFNLKSSAFSPNKSIHLVKKVNETDSSSVFELIFRRNIFPECITFIRSLRKVFKTINRIYRTQFAIQHNIQVLETFRIQKFHNNIVRNFLLVYSSSMFLTCGEMGNWL